MLMKFGKVIGLDLSLSNTGIAVWNRTGTPKNQADCDSYFLEFYSLLSGQNNDLDARLLTMVNSIMLEPCFSDEARNILPELVVLEGLSFASNMGKSQERAALHYMVRQQMIAMGLPFIVVPPSSLKKFICKVGFAKKELMMKEVFRRYGVDAADNNQADAAGLCFFGASFLDFWPMQADQKEQMVRFKAVKVPKPKKGKKTY